MDKTTIQQMLLGSARSIFDAHPDEFLPDFLDWLEFNIDVYHAFEREAWKVWDTGRRHYSHRTICEYLRHETAVQEKGSGFKIDHDRVGCLGRLFIYLHPQCEGFFSFRSSSLRKAA